MKKQGKKWLAVLLTCALLATMGLTAFAAGDPVEVTLVGEKTVEAGGAYTVTVQADKAKAGGIQGTLTYNTEYFTFDNVSVTADFAAANHLAAAAGESTTDTAELFRHSDGKLTFVLLAGGEGSDWITVHFTAADAAGTADFALEALSVSDAVGSGLQTATAANLTDVQVTKAKDPIGELTMDGATVRTDGTADLRWQVTNVTDIAGADGAKVEFGVIMLPKIVLGDGELVCDPEHEYSYGDKTFKATIAKVEVDSIPAAELLYATLGGSGEERWRQKFAARAFLKVGDEVVYSANTAADKGITAGTSVRACTDVAKAIGEKIEAQGDSEYFKTGAEAWSALKAKATDSWGSDEYTGVVEQIKTYLDAHDGTFPWLQ